ncbi:ATP-binding protein [Salinimicrobium sp. 3283s]|uniref:ATP-binding protein n=1 Tax=Salinimicrobium sp. 3283s TaxID=3114359 RepID=UPI0031EB16EF
MDKSSLKYPVQVDLENCAKEPIHFIGKSQAHGVLVVCDRTNLNITQAGENASEYFGIPVDELLGKPLSYLLKMPFLAPDFDEDNLPQEVEVNRKKFLVLAHISEESLVLDFEPLAQVQDPFFFQKQLTGILNKFQTARSLEELSSEAAKLTRKMFGYDRVMIYRFDEEWNGEVIAETKNDDLESWLGLRYPATDIPEQSRKMFLKHRVRIIANVHYTPVPLKPEISPVTGKPLDISRSSLRAVSPIHIEYLKNMGVGASLSAAIVVKGKLWGLIACHHQAEKHLDFYQRESCRFLAQMLSTEITLHETSSLLSHSEQTESIRRQLVAQMKYHDNIVEALSRDTVQFLELLNCSGGAIFYINEWELNGQTPGKEQLDSLLNNFIKKQSKSLFWTRNLSALFPEAEEYKKTASGLFSLKISDNKYILWFKPEVVQVVTWGGNPQNKVFYNEKEQRLSPRKSFEKWSEKLTGFSEPWHELDRNTARALRENISHVLLTRQRREIEALNEKLIEANRELELFSYGLSHDLRAPVRGMEGFLKILREDFSNPLGSEGLKYLEMSTGLTQKMNDLIDDILEYSRLGHIERVEKHEVDTTAMLKEIFELFNLSANFPSARIEIQEELPPMWGNRRMLFQLWSNLLNNALKYSSEKEAPVIEVGKTLINGRSTFYVKDNGIGVDPALREKIFETFQRGVGSKFKGTGIGLAIVKRIVEKHEGEIWVESEPGEGSVFYFYLEPQK